MFVLKLQCVSSKKHFLLIFYFYRSCNTHFYYYCSCSFYDLGVALKTGWQRNNFLKVPYQSAHGMPKFIIIWPKIRLIVVLRNSQLNITKKLSSLYYKILFYVINYNINIDISLNITQSFWIQRLLGFSIKFQCLPFESLDVLEILSSRIFYL